MSSTDNQRRLNLAYIWDLGFLPLGGSMVAVSVNFFLAPARIPDGTMISLGMVAQYLFGLWAECFAVLRRIRRPKPHHTGQAQLNKNICAAAAKGASAALNFVACIRKPRAATAMAAALSI